MNTKSTTILFSVLIIAIAGTVFFVYWSQTKTASEVTMTEQLRPNSNTPTQAKNFYSNSEHGFELELPTGWVVTEHSNSISFSSPEMYRAMKQNEEYCKNPQTGRCVPEFRGGDVILFFESYLDDAMSETVQNRKIGKTNFTIFETEGLVSEIDYETKNNGNPYVFSIVNNPPFPPIEKILSTLKFDN